MITFLVLSLLTLVGGVITISARNAVHASLGLVGTLLSVAGIYATLNASFLAATQVIVYAGAVMVLFLFVIMLLDANRPVEDARPAAVHRAAGGRGRRGAGGRVRHSGLYLQGPAAAGRELGGARSTAHPARSVKPC